MITAMTAAEISHATVEVIFIIFLIFVSFFMVFVASRVNRNSNNLNKLVLDNQADRIARDKALIVVKEETLALAREAQAAAERLHTDLRENTKLTIAAAEESRAAMSVANHMNEKIAETNQRLLDTVQGVTKKEATLIHEHIEESVELGKDVKQTVDELKDKL